MNKVGKISICAALTFIMATSFISIAKPIKAEDSLFDAGDMFYVEKASGEDFTVLQFTDTHVQSANQGKTDVYPFTRKWVDSVQPDMIVITGDGVNGSVTKNGDDMRSLISEMNSYGVPWTFVFGNHEKDADGGIPTINAVLLDEMNNNPDTFLMYRQGPFASEGRYGNYVVNIEQKGKIINSLFFLDSGREYETFTQSQTQWYIDGVKLLSETYCGEYAPFKGNVIPSMVFHHIPTDEYQYAANSVLSGSYTITEEDGSEYTYQNIKIGKVPSSKGSGSNQEIAYGQRDARVKNARIFNTQADDSLLEYSMYDDPRSQAGFFSVVKDMHSTTHMFCGHRHTNDATVTYEGITLTFGTKTGHGNGYDANQTGCTVITIENRTNAISVKHKYD